MYVNVSINTEQEDDNLNNLKMFENTDVYVYGDHTTYYNKTTIYAYVPKSR